MQEPSSRRTRRDVWRTGLLGLSWVACAVLINPIGDFPLNDDWAFGSPVEVLLQRTELSDSRTGNRPPSSLRFSGCDFLPAGGFLVHGSAHLDA